MSLPTVTANPAQPSIRSFFQSQAPKYAPPPNSTSRNNAGRPVLPPVGAAAAGPLSAPPRASPVSSGPPSPLSPSPTLPHEAAIRTITSDDVNAFRRINALLLSVSYPDSFYQRAIDPAASGRFSRVITWTYNGEEPKIVGGIVCRVEPDVDTRSADQQIPQNLYIQSLCLLSPYRSMGLIKAALEDVIASAVSNPGLDVRTVTAHVWTENDEGLHWYEARGFRRQEPPIKGYYLKLRPDSAWLVQRRVGATVRGSLPSSIPQPPRPTINSTTAAVMNLPSLSEMPKSSSSNVSRPPPRAGSGQSYQNQRAETEWNDLPAEMMLPSLLAPPRKIASEPGSSASSRSSSTARKKKDRSYPAAAFSG